MRAPLFTLVACAAFSRLALAQEVIYRNTISEQSVETSDLLITLDSVDDDVRFSVTLEEKETGLQRRYEFDGQGASDPIVFQLGHMYYCDTAVVLLTVEYPWRHALPEFVRVLSTFAFRISDFAFIDVAYGPLTDIALADNTAYEPSDLDMLPPIRVRCLAGGNGKPFEFVQEETN